MDNIELFEIELVIQQIDSTIESNRYHSNMAFLIELREELVQYLQDNKREE